MKHKHHVIPKHMGGNDNPENIVELTIEEHANAHKKLYEEHGMWQDLLAWKGLSGLITHDECVFIAIREGAKKGAVNGNRTRWGPDIKFKTDPDYVPSYKKQFGYDVSVDGRKVRTKRYWFNDGQKEGQFSLDNYPDGWKRGRLKSVMKKTNKYVSL
jgi:hypothetical protein